MQNLNEKPNMARLLAERLRAAGGRAFFVGGYVRDRVLAEHGRSFGKSDDVDVEVYGLHPSELREVLSEFGNVFAIGESFGVYTIGGTGLEISMPRKERATGIGHRDFEVHVNPFMTYEDSLLRRDFTVNAMLADCLTGELIDPYGGVRDAKLGVLRHVNDGTFVEDSLRLYRGCGFASRFGMSIAEETVALCSRMDDAALPMERVFAELVKVLKLSDKPSLFFRELRRMGKLTNFFTETEGLIGCEQNPIYHPEGDVWNHTMLALDEAALLRDKSANGWKLPLAALCHDLGKPASSTVDEDGKIRSIGHEVAGVEVARRQLKRIVNDKRLIHYVLEMVRQHMRPNMLARSQSSVYKTNVMFDECAYPEDLLLLSLADMRASGGRGKADELSAFLRQRLEIYKDYAMRPMVTGKDLIELGFTPGPTFPSMIKKARLDVLGGTAKSKIMANLLKEAVIRRDL
ncbi:MAG: HD domain-containing protein [Oscillospiraceae bacterium]|jgi:tRNA nucleotidyltransferase (CCA-adding enzyme)|nr:HD domain-containing protein [Oscillospiraceae bacterium]